MTCYVYVIEAGNHIKVGFSNDPDKRMREMQTGSPHELRVALRIPCETREKAYQLEQEFHEKMKLWHHRGEWFLRDGLNVIGKARMPILRSRTRQEHRDGMFNRREERLKKVALENERMAHLEELEILNEAKQRIG